MRDVIMYKISPSYVVLFILISVVFSQQSYAENRCQRAEQAFNQAQGTDATSIEQALKRLQDESCSPSFIQHAQDALYIARATVLIKAKRYDEAKSILQQVEQDTWMLLATLGDVSLATKKYSLAAKQYSRAYTLAVTDNMEENLQKQLYNLAEKTQLLAGTLKNSVTRGGKPQGIFASRGFKPESRAVPIQFEYNSSTLDSAGKENAAQLAVFLKQDSVSSLQLTGHTDTKGSAQYNQKLSEKRAITLKKYLEEQGLTVDITTIGKGEAEPLDLSDSRFSLLPQSEINKMLRRVEFTVSH